MNKEVLMRTNQSRSSNLSYVPRPVGQCVLVSGHHLGPATSFSFPSVEIMFRQFGVCYYGAVSMTKGRVCNLQLLLDLASTVFLRSESCGTHGHILLPQFWESLNMEGKVAVFISPKEQGGPVIPPPPRTLGSLFIVFLRLAGLRWSYSNSPPRGITTNRLRCIHYILINKCDTDHIENTVYNTYCCVYSLSWNVFTMPLLSHICLFCLHHSGFQILRVINN
jgi:hypothetical protein